MAVHCGTPALMSCSIWSTRITELRMIMPSSAVMPSCATNPIGARSSNSVAAAPIRPSGPVRNTMVAREKLCSCSISSVKMMKMHSGNCAAMEAPALPLSSSAPATVMR
ncbi:hypothetical protein D3C72_2089990 [compost metagenome]